MENLNEAFEDLIKDIYNAEKQITKALPKMIKKASDSDLKAALEQHLEETNDQIAKVEQVAQTLGFKPTGVVCHGMQGVIEEGDEHLKDGKPGPVMDALIIASAQKVEHYEICSYGTARTWAKQLGLKEVVPTLEGILDQESATDEKLNKLAISCINQEAIAGDRSSKSKASMK